MIKKKISYHRQKYAPQTRFLMKQNAPQAKLFKQNAPQARFQKFLNKSFWVLCPVNAVYNCFFTNHSSESSSFN